MLMEKNTMENGKKIKVMDLAITFGLMDRIMKVNLSMVISRGMV